LVKSKYSKDDYEKLFNELLGLDVSWSKLPKEDLTQLAVFFSNPEIAIKKLSSGKIDNKLSSVIGEVVMGVIDRYDGPIVNKLKKMAGLSG